MVNYKLQLIMLTHTYTHMNAHIEGCTCAHTSSPQVCTCVHTNTHTQMHERSHAHCHLCAHAIVVHMNYGPAYYAQSFTTMLLSNVQNVTNYTQYYAHNFCNHATVCIQFYYL